MDRQRLHATVLRNARDGDAIAVLNIPPSAHFERHRHVHRCHHRSEDASHQMLVSHQSRTGRLPADLLRGTAHIDVDDLRTFVYVQSCGIRKHARIRPGDLHAARQHLIAVRTAAPRQRGIGEIGSGGNHFRDHETSTRAPGQLAKRQIGDASHGRQRHTIRQLIGADANQAASPNGCAGGAYVSRALKGEGMPDEEMLAGAISPKQLKATQRGQVIT